MKNAFVRWREMAREESLIWISIGWPLPLSLSRSGRRKGAAERRFSLIKFDYRRSLRVLVLLPETGYVTRRRAECDTTREKRVTLKISLEPVFNVLSAEKIEWSSEKFQKPSWFGNGEKYESSVRIRKRLRRGRYWETEPERISVQNISILVYFAIWREYRAGSVCSELLGKLEKSAIFCTSEKN